jgi:hypothetical protein
MSKEVRTKFGVARNESLVGDLFDTPGEAQAHLGVVEAALQVAGLEPDVRVVTVEETVTYGRPHVYKDEPSQGEGVELSAEGTWGGEGAAPQEG